MVQVLRLHVDLDHTATGARLDCLQPGAGARHQLCGAARAGTSAPPHPLHGTASKESPWADCWPSWTASFIIHAEARSLQTTANGWSTTLACGAARKDIGILRRAACASDVSALSVPEEEVYWQAFVDGVGEKLNGKHDYLLHFPPGGLPPNEATWSVTVGDSGRRMVENPIHRYAVGGKSGLVANADGSIDIHLQNAAPTGHEANWLPVPSGAFMLWLRVYTTWDGHPPGRVPGAAGGASEMTSGTHHHFLVFAAVALVAWVAGTFAFVYYQPQLFYRGVRRAVVRGLGFKKDGLPVNTFYAFPTLAAPSLSKSNLVLTGNRDTLYVGGALDLGRGAPGLTRAGHGRPLVQPGAVRLPWLDVVGIVGRRTTGTRAGDYVIVGPQWKGTVPEGMRTIASPSNSLLAIGRVLVEGDGDLSTAHDLAKQIQVTPFAARQRDE